MSNPFNVLNNSNQMFNNSNIQSIKNAYQLLTNSKNPMQVFNMLAQNNPAMKPILNMLNNGGNPQQIFMNMCKERGINANEFLKQITSK